MARRRRRRRKQRRVPNAPLREAALEAVENGATWGGIAYAANIRRPSRHGGADQGDSGTLKIVLGVRPLTVRRGGKPYRSLRCTLSEDDAERIALAIGMDLQDAGV